MSVNGIQITDVSVYPVKNKAKGSLVEAYARITLNDQLIMSGLRLVRGKKGLFLGFPQEYNKAEGKGYDICFPISIELRMYMTQEILRRLESLTSKLPAVAA